MESHDQQGALQKARDDCDTSLTKQTGLNIDVTGGVRKLFSGFGRDRSGSPAALRGTGETMSFDARPDPDRVFLDALADGKLIVQSCLSCGGHRAPPAECCPACGELRHHWTPSVCTGWLERAILLGEPDSFGDDPEITRAIGAVRLSEGPTVSVRLVGSIPKVGAEVRVEVVAGSLIAHAVAAGSARAGGLST